MTVETNVCIDYAAPAAMPSSGVAGSNEQLLIYALCDFIRDAIKDRRAPVQTNNRNEAAEMVAFDVKDGWALPRQQGAPIVEKPTIHVMPAFVETKEFNEITLQVEARTHSWGSDGYTYAFSVLIAIRDALFEAGIVDERYPLQPEGTKLVMFDDVNPPIWCGGLHVKFTVPTRQRINPMRY